MTNLVDSIKEASGNIFKQNIKDNVRSLRGVISEAQSMDPGSKYLGTSIMPGVKSEREVNKDKKTKRTDDTNRAAAAAAEKNKPIPMPSIAAEDLSRKRAAARRQQGGRASTILSDTLG